MKNQSDNHSSNSLHGCEAERRELLRLHDSKHRSWPEIAQMERYSKIPMTSLYMFAMDKRPLKDEHKIRLGIPVEKTAPACSACGEVHAYDRACEMKVTIKAKAKPRRRKWRDINEGDLLWALQNRHAPRWS